jgi:hypothetical protein
MDGPYIGFIRLQIRAVSHGIKKKCSSLKVPEMPKSGRTAQVLMFPGKLSGRRMLIWRENPTLAAWACGACNWTMQNPGVAAAAGPPPKVLEAFTQHDCADSEPQAVP